MASVPNIVLQKGQCLVQNTGASALGIVLQNSQATLQWGYIWLASDLNELYVAGNYILYNPQNQLLLSYSGDNYALLYERDILFKENYIPPP